MKWKWECQWQCDRRPFLRRFRVLLCCVPHCFIPPDLPRFTFLNAGCRSTEPSLHPAGPTFHAKTDSVREGGLRLELGFDDPVPG
ncbi:hypothetical protein BJX65DRAFT_275473, partial [Aspergillus insuetus]